MPRTSRSSRPLSSAQRRKRVAQTLEKLLGELGCSLTGELRGTPARVAGLWVDHLLAGEALDAAAVLGRGSRSRSRAPVTLVDVGVHLVCPHHLTVAFGRAHVAYLPGGRLAGFGALARLIQTCTARLVLQEDAANAVAEALVEHLGATAAVALIEAKHPCHNVPHARSHRARAVTWGRAGETRGIRELTSLVRSALPRHDD